MAKPNVPRGPLGGLRAHLGSLGAHVGGLGEALGLIWEALGGLGAPFWSLGAPFWRLGGIFFELGLKSVIFTKTYVFLCFYDFKGLMGSCLRPRGHQGDHFGGLGGLEERREDKMGLRGTKRG